MSEAGDSGELRELLVQLDAVHAEMISADLRDLQIPAVVRDQPAVADEMGENLPRDRFQILVPAAFLQIAREVVDVGCLRPESEAPQVETPRDPDVPPAQATGPLQGRVVHRAGGGIATVGLVAVLLLAVALVANRCG